MVTLKDDKFFIESVMGIQATLMTDMTVTFYPPDSLVALVPKTVYTIGGYRFVPRKMFLRGVVAMAPAPDNMGGDGTGALHLTLSGGGVEQKIYLSDSMGEERSEWSGDAGSYTANVSYGNRVLNLPFSIRLNDFIVERYPGSNSPSGFRSDVTLLDPSHGTEFGYEIYMNHILKYRGFRFYQSSYDKDKGTILSVNDDPAGMLTTYAGYFLLFLFIVLSIINRKSFFRTVGKGYWSSRYRRVATVSALLLAFASFAPAGAQHLIIDRAEADRFGEVLAQDQKGRTKPLYTISNDILRKVAKENDFDGLSSMQVFLGYSLDFFHWQNVPLIKVSNAELQNLLGIKGDRASFSDIVDFNEGGGGYKLSEHVDKAYSKAESERTRLDKEIIKLDERVNICYMMSRGDFLHLFPLRDGTDHWGKAEDAVKNTMDQRLPVRANCNTFMGAVSNLGGHCRDRIRGVPHRHKKLSEGQF